MRTSASPENITLIVSDRLLEGALEGKRAEEPVHVGKGVRGVESARQEVGAGADEVVREGGREGQAGEEGGKLRRREETAQPLHGCLSISCVPMRRKSTPSSTYWNVTR